MVARPRPRRSRLARWSWWLAFLGVPVLLFAAFAHRFSVISTPAMLILMAAGFALAFAGVVAAAASLNAIWRDGRSGFGIAMCGLILGLAILVIPAVGAWRIVTLPRIADVTTDTVDPPAFAFAGMDGARHPARPSPGDIAMQRAAYPDILSHRYPVGVNRVLEQVRALADLSGWHVLDEFEPVSADGTARIEAVAMTSFFASRNDLVIRIEPDGNGSRVDMRSASRYVKHDLGVNAARIRGFLASLDSALAGAIDEE